MAASVFTRIIKGELPAHRIYEDAVTLAILDIRPMTPGHTMVIPKEPIDHLWDLPDELFQHVMAVARRVAERQQAVLAPRRVGMTVEGFGVPHAHVHVFPLSKGLVATTLDFSRRQDQTADDNQLAEMARRLAF